GRLFDPGSEKSCRLQTPQDAPKCTEINAKKAACKKAAFSSSLKLDLTLRILRRFAGPFQTRLLAFFHARIAREQTIRTQQGFVFLINGEECSSHPHSYGISLTGHTAAIGLDSHGKLA